MSFPSFPCFALATAPSQFMPRLSLAMRLPWAQLSLALMLTLGLIPALAGPVSTCDANGSLYYVGEWYFLDSDHCTQCECTPEGPACARTDCTALPPACIHVSHYPSDCCPRCERVGCEHRGQVYELGQHFQPSECEQCTCDIDGIARCLVADCAPPPCVNPVYEKGHCCPTCKDGPNCYVDGSQRQIIPSGESVWVGHCMHCRCHDGQDAGYWEGNRVAKCELLPGCQATAGHHA
ncbi:PREDICTED: von Willebrand factor C domain-containing protein 2-like [Gekko japonicus]|uniref:von Willebrand factor C domain-containing protein 2-like n=1 Tax=Gekko japonicus TaxID=146911 RepID=A0ABM1KXK8_GEKJA|nr:PREDICTED: von Willebrand factor C domain-containing protein 2-like [Gekko japonicus]